MCRSTRLRFLRTMKVHKLMSHWSCLSLGASTGYPGVPLGGDTLLELGIYARALLLGCPICLIKTTIAKGREDQVIVLGSDQLVRLLFCFDCWVFVCHVHIFRWYAQNHKIWAHQIIQVFLWLFGPCFSPDHWQPAVFLREHRLCQCARRKQDCSSSMLSVQVSDRQTSMLYWCDHPKCLWGWNIAIWRVSSMYWRIQYHRCCGAIVASVSPDLNPWNTFWNSCLTLIWMFTKPFCAAEALLARHGAKRIVLSLGAYGSETLKNVTRLDWFQKMQLENVVQDCIVRYTLFRLI